MDAIVGIAERYGLYIIEDCAHQPGSMWKGKSVGSIGNIGSFSFQSTKIINSGEGGMLTTNNERTSNLLQSLKICGRSVQEGAPAMHSSNYRMTEFQAAILLAQLRRLDEQNVIRHKNAMYLEQRISDIKGLSPLYRNPNITRQSYYCLTIKYNKEEWEGVSKTKFMKALCAELNNTVICSNTYEPLNCSLLYRPFNKNTHKISDDYCKAINPAGFDLPICKRAYENEAVNFYHTMLLLSEAGIDILVDAILKIRENINELIKFSMNSD